ncbi:hypothetical protein DXG01_000881 [Tephrocybe rancida]|nr:hypothetical protein DXG01_000881 [Tephrocybe rancida]
MTATRTTWPERSPLPYGASTGQSRLHAAITDASTRLAMDDTSSNFGGSLSDSSLTDDEDDVNGLLASSIKPKHSLLMPTLDIVASANTQTPVEPSRGRIIVGLHLIMFYLSYPLDAMRSVALFVARECPFLLSVFGPAIVKTITVPLCGIDLIAPTYLCAPTYRKGAEFLRVVDTKTSEEGNIVWADFTGLAEVQKALADYFVGDGLGASELAIKIAKAELATSDLVVAVRYSTLRTAEELADSLSVFVQDAGDAGDGLQELDAKAMGAIDSIVNLNIWALKAIEEAQVPPGVLSALAIWQSKKSTKDIINDNFNGAMRAQDVILSHLITQAKISQGQLKRMKERLQAIRDLTLMENIHINAQHGELLASMWTTFGSNRQDIERYKTNLELLESLEEYTDIAKAHIAQALTNLKTMQAQMKDLREKVSQPDITGTTIPVEVHIRTIMDGIKRMKEGRIRARERESDIRTIGA